MRIAFISVTDATEGQILHSKSDNVETMRGTDTNEIIEDFIISYMKRYQESLETKMQGSSYKFERVELLNIIFIRYHQTEEVLIYLHMIGYLTKNRQ